MRAEIISLLNPYSPEYAIERKYKDLMLAFLTQEQAPFSRENEKGHFTASAWVLSKDHACVLLTEHAKLGQWFQLGGHIEPPDTSFMQACLREVAEESGIAVLNVNHSFLIDIDIHTVPQNKGIAEHQHYDLTMCFIPDVDLEIVCSKESLQLAWVPLDKIAELTQDAALLRMVAKTSKFLDLEIKV